MHTKNSPRRADQSNPQGYREQIKRDLDGHNVPTNILGLYVDGLTELAETLDQNHRDNSSLQECVRNIIAYYASDTLSEPDRRARINAMIEHTTEEARTYESTTDASDAQKEDIARTLRDIQREIGHSAHQNLHRTGRTGRTPTKVRQRW